jgi:hypothetical protein
MCKIPGKAAPDAKFYLLFVCICDIVIYEIETMDADRKPNQEPDLKTSVPILMKTSSATPQKLPRVWQIIPGVAENYANNDAAAVWGEESQFHLLKKDALAAARDLTSTWRDMGADDVSYTVQEVDEVWKRYYLQGNLQVSGCGLADNICTKASLAFWINFKERLAPHQTRRNPNGKNSRSQRAV